MKFSQITISALLFIGVQAGPLVVKNAVGDIVLKKRAAGVIKVNDARCSGARPTEKTTIEGGPNGSIDWLDCGIHTNGWDPAYVTVNDLVIVDLDDAVNDKSSSFAKYCSQHVDVFKKFGQKYEIPPIFLASFAMQESSCRSDAHGPTGESGLMQLTSDKCKDAPTTGDKCADVNYNVETAAKLFKNTLDSFGGNVLQAVGSYNGWESGTTSIAHEDEIAKKEGGKFCMWQQNLDYLQQFFNGWIVNVDPYAHKLGKFHNLLRCSSK